LPLYSGAISKERANQLAGLLKTSKRFHPKFPVPTVPTDSSYFGEHRYWQGPVWINMNWLIIDGLKRCGHKELAEEITRKSIELVEKSGFHEYFSPLDGSPAGVDNFSWTAALTIDMVSDRQ
jgi:glycogen debranching enzyme